MPDGIYLVQAKTADKYTAVKVLIK